MVGIAAGIEDILLNILELLQCYLRKDRCTNRVQCYEDKPCFFDVLLEFTDNLPECGTQVLLHDARGGSEEHFSESLSTLLTALMSKGTQATGLKPVVNQQGSH